MLNIQGISIEGGEHYRIYYETKKYKAPTKTVSDETHFTSQILKFYITQIARHAMERFDSRFPRHGSKLRYREPPQTLAPVPGVLPRVGEMIFEITEAQMKKDHCVESATAETDRER